VSNRIRAQPLGSFLRAGNDALRVKAIHFVAQLHAPGAIEEPRNLAVDLAVVERRDDRSQVEAIGGGIVSSSGLS